MHSKEWLFQFLGLIPVEFQANISLLDFFLFHSEWRNMQAVELTDLQFFKMASAYLIQ